MADHNRFPNTLLFQNIHHTSCCDGGRIVRWLQGLGSFPKSQYIRHDTSISQSLKIGYLMSPDLGCIRKAMYENDRGFGGGNGGVVVIVMATTRSVLFVVRGFDRHIV